MQKNSSMIPAQWIHQGIKAVLNLFLNKQIALNHMSWIYTSIQASVANDSVSYVLLFIRLQGSTGWSGPALSAYAHRHIFSCCC